MLIHRFEIPKKKTTASRD